MAAPKLKNIPKVAIFAWDEASKSWKAVTIDSSGGMVMSGDVHVLDSAGVIQDWVMPEGQEASANSMPMVLSTEQEAILSNIDSNIDSIEGSLTTIAYEITPTSTLLAVDSGDSTITYIGKSFPGTATSAASWQIKRMTDTSGDLVIQFADGSAVAGQIWDDRESLSYS